MRLHPLKSLCVGVELDFRDKLVLSRSKKSKQIIHFLFFFSTTTVLASHLGNVNSLIILALRNLSNSSWMIKFLAGTKFLLFWWTRLKLGSTFNLWVIISLDMSIISSCFQGKVDFLSSMNLVNSYLRSWLRSVPSSTLMLGSASVSKASLNSLSFVSRTYHVLFFYCYAFLGMAEFFHRGGIDIFSFLLVIVDLDHSPWRWHLQTLIVSW